MEVADQIVLLIPVKGLSGDKILMWAFHWLQVGDLSHTSYSTRTTQCSVVYACMMCTCSKRVPVHKMKEIFYDLILYCILS